MKTVTTTLKLMARWVAVLAVAVVVVQERTSARIQSATQSNCEADCAAKCPCCVSESAPAQPSPPVAPASSSRASVERDFQLFLMPLALTTSERRPVLALPEATAQPHFPAAISIFMRHCTFLL